jgi:hypothetical protein
VLGEVRGRRRAPRGRRCARLWIRRGLSQVSPGRRRSRCHDRAPARSPGERRVRGAYQLELSGRDGITRELLGLRAGSLPGVRLASARPTRRRAASA